MATDKLITMKQFNGTDYDTLYPKTIVEQVDGVYNKQEILEDTTKSMFGYGSSAIPDTIFQWLGKYNQYWWKRRATGEHTEEVRTAKTAPTVITHASGQTTVRVIQYADKVAFDDSGNPYLVNPVSLNVSYSLRNSALSKMLGKYVTNIYASPSTIYFVPESTTFSEDWDSSDPYYETIFASTIYSITGTTVTDKGSWNYLNSSDRSAYPDSGESGGYEYQYLGIPFESAVNAPKIATGSYIGTGTYGSSNPNTISLPGTPILLVIESNFLYANDSMKNITRASYSLTVIDTGDSRIVSWYSGDSADYQGNVSGRTYKYTALIW